TSMHAIIHRRSSGRWSGSSGPRRWCARGWRGRGARSPRPNGPGPASRRSWACGPPWPGIAGADWRRGNEPCRTAGRRASVAEAGSRILSAPGSPPGEPPTSDASAAPLRRLDWRFLLPMPPGGRPWDHVALAGGSGPLARRLVEVGFARRVTTGPVSNADPVDVLVVLNGEALPPAALAALRPGGFCLWEARLTLPRPRSPEAAVARAGLVPVTRYAVLPRHDAAKVYLPVDSPGAMGWVMETLLPPSTPLRRLLAA